MSWNFMARVRENEVKLRRVKNESFQTGFENDGGNFFYPSVKTVSSTLKGKRVSCICKPLPLVKQYKMIEKVQT